MPAVTMSEMLQAVRDEANQNYNKYGWGFLIETMSEDDIRDLIGTARSINTAIKNCRRHCRILDASRREVFNSRH